MNLTQEQITQFHEEGWLFIPELFSPEEVAVLKREAEAIYREHRPEVWREKNGSPRTAFAAHTYNEAFRLLGAHPAHDPPGRAAVRRARLHAPIQDQREVRLHRRGVAVAPGLRHLAARRRHDGAAGDEHLRLPRRGDADQRPAAAGAAQPDRRQPRGRRTTSRPRHTRCGRSTTRRSLASSSRAASWRRPARLAAC